MGKTTGTSELDNPLTFPKITEEDLFFLDETGRRIFFSDVVLPSEKSTETITNSDITTVDAPDNEHPFTKPFANITHVGPLEEPNPGLVASASSDVSPYAELSSPATFIAASPPYAYAAEPDAEMLTGDRSANPQIAAGPSNPTAPNVTPSSQSSQQSPKSSSSSPTRFWTESEMPVDALFRNGIDPFEDLPDFDGILDDLENLSEPVSPTRNTNESEETRE